MSRRTPRAGELAWALRRFELGCERASAVEALTDWLLAARALLADPDQPGYAGVAERMAAICAPPEDRAARGGAASATRSRSSAPPWPGLVRAEPDVEELISELGANLRAMLRDVLCGHLEPALRRVADELMAEQPEPVDTLH